jgi:hypothetical protein
MICFQQSAFHAAIAEKQRGNDKLQTNKSFVLWCPRGSKNLIEAILPKIEALILLIELSFKARVCGASLYCQQRYISRSTEKQAPFRKTQIPEKVQIQRKSSKSLEKPFISYESRSTENRIQQIH